MTTVHVGLIEWPAGGQEAFVYVALNRTMTEAAVAKRLVEAKDEFSNAFLRASELRFGSSPHEIIRWWIEESNGDIPWPTIFEREIQL